MDHAFFCQLNYIGRLIRKINIHTLRHRIGKRERTCIAGYFKFRCHFRNRSCLIRGKIVFRRIRLIIADGRNQARIDTHSPRHRSVKRFGFGQWSFSPPEFRYPVSDISHLCVADSHCGKIFAEHIPAMPLSLIFLFFFLPDIKSRLSRIR